MSRVLRIGLVVLVAAVAAGLARSWLVSDRRLIARQLDDLAVTLSVEGNEAPVARMAAAARVGRFVTDDVIISADGGSSTVEGRDGVVALAAQARGASGALRVSFDDVQIALTDPTGATVYMTASASSRDAQGASLLDAREVSVTLRKVEGAWLIARVDVLRTLERAQ